MPQGSITYNDSSVNKTDYFSRFYCSPEMASEKGTSTVTTQPFTPKEEKISEKKQSLDIVFLFFLICFLITSQIINKRGRMLSTMFSGLFRQKERKSIFSATIGNELYSKLLLCLQTTIILSIFIYTWFSHDFQSIETSSGKVLLIIGGSCFSFILYFLYKWLTYIVIGKIFFNKDAVEQWLDNFTSIICILGIILFIPVLLMFYIDSAYFFCYYFIISCLFLLAATIIYRIYVLFFHDMSLLLYLFLYLCAQEIAPLVILYEGLIYFFNVVEKSTLWI